MPGRVEDFLLSNFKLDTRYKHFAHIDQSLSTDSTGLAIAHKEVDKAGALVVLDLMLKIDPPGKPDQISVRKVREFLFYLKKNRGLNISLKTNNDEYNGLLTYDQFACLRGDSLVLTRVGHKEIKEIVEGDEVYSEDGWRKVIKVHKYENAPVMELVSNRGHKLVATPNHRIKMLKGWEYSGKENKRKPVWEYRKFKDIKYKDVIKTSDLCDICVDYEEKEDYLAELLGIYVGEGYLQVKREKGKEYWTMSFCAGDKEEAEHIQELVYKLLGKEYKINKEKSEYKLNVSDTGFVKYLMGRGLKKQCSYEKEVPEFLKGYKIKIAEFLKGLFSAGGGVSGVKGNEGQVSLTSTSYKLIFQVKLLLSDYFGLSSSISEADQGKYKGTKGNRRVYYLRVNGSRKRFYEQIGFSYKRKKDILERYQNIEGRNTFSRVKSIQDIGFETVYDITVEGNPSYIVNSIVSHNSAEAIQEANNEGMEAERQSVDKDSSQYDLMIDLILRRRLKGYYYQPFKEEIFFLEKDKEKRKVDHCKGMAKDVSDAAAGAVFSAWVHGKNAFSWVDYVG